MCGERVNFGRSVAGLMAMRTRIGAQAEAEIREQSAALRDASPAFLSVQSQAFVYTCRYDRNCAAYRPGDFAPGDPIRFRVTDGKLFLKLTDSRELETTIIRKIEQRS